MRRMCFHIHCNGVFIIMIIQELHIVVYSDCIKWISDGQEVSVSYLIGKQVMRCIVSEI